MSNGKSKANGNGAAPPQPPTKITDVMEARVLLLYLVQKLQMPTLDEILTIAKSGCFAIIHKATAGRVLDGLAKGGFIAKGMRPLEGGLTADVYSMKTLNFQNPPEYAHINSILPELLRTDAAMKLKAQMDGQETDSKTAKKPRGNVVGEYHMFRVKARTLDCLLGSQIPNPYLNTIREKFPTALDMQKAELEGIFDRDEATGAFRITPDVLQGWFISNALRYFDGADARGRYVGFEPLLIPHNKVTVQQVILPVNSDRGVSAPKKYEGILAGAEIVFNFIAPIKGLATTEQYEAMFITAGLRPRRGLSPARGRRFGRFEVTSFEHLGPVKSQSFGLLAEQVSDGNAYLKNAIARLAKVNLGTNFVGPSDDVTGPPSDNDDE